MPRLDKAAITDRMRGALLTFKTMHDRLLRARVCAKSLSAADAEAFWAGPGRSSKQHTDAAAWWAVTAYKAYVAAGLAGSACSSEQALVLAANQHLDREALPPWRAQEPGPEHGQAGRGVERGA
jgi:hypothetical protein